MALTGRGRFVGAFTTSVAVIALVVLFVVVGGSAGVPDNPAATRPVGEPTTEPSQPATSPSPLPPPPTVCPLTGMDPDGDVPIRPALAVKVENLPTARPQIGLDFADIVYEEPVEIGITRFIALYQCRDADRIEPVRSARTTDPDILVQYGSPLIAYSGAVPKVVRKLTDAGLIQLTEGTAADAYHRDPEREKPHNLFSSSEELYAAGGAAGGLAEGAPEQVFTYSRRPSRGGQDVFEFFVPFSHYSDVSWRWWADRAVWLRYDTGEPHLLANESQIQAANVIVQKVDIVMTDITDVNGAPSPAVVATGSGTAFVFRNGKLFKGTWERPTLADVTRFYDQDGREIALAPGTTWIELLPNDIDVTWYSQG